MKPAICTCEDCLANAEANARMRAALRSMESPPVDIAGMRRLERRVMESITDEPSRRPSRSWAVLAFATMLLSAGSAVYVATRPAAPVVVSSHSDTTVDTIDVDGARFTRKSEGELERVELTAGTLRLRVHQVPGGKRVIVKVPDGEIEDRGTVFVVVVENGHTQRIAVEEGQVAVRLDDVNVTLTAGASWERPKPAPTVAVSVKSLPSVAVSAPPVVVVPSAKVAPAPPPSDGEEEDAAYLDVVRLVRQGKSEEAKSAARDYLRRFPSGFRRDEMNRIAH